MAKPTGAGCGSMSSASGQPHSRACKEGNHSQKAPGPRRTNQPSGYITPWIMDNPPHRKTFARIYLFVPPRSKRNPPLNSRSPRKVANCAPYPATSLLRLRWRSSLSGTRHSLRSSWSFISYTKRYRRCGERALARILRAKRAGRKWRRGVSE